MPDRTALINAFLSMTPWANSQRITIAGDASNRRYERLTQKTGQSAILMDAPPDKGEDTRPFVQITEFLRKAELSAPKIYAQDSTNGFLLIEDFGDDLFARIMTKNPAVERPLYEAATDVLLHLHQYNPPAITRCDPALMTDMVSLAFTWYQRAVVGQTDETAQDKFQSAFHKALLPLDERTNVLIQRDYHAENLIWMPDRIGVAKVGLLDYQDALIGHRAYDLVSIMQDARRDVSPEIARDMITRYVSASSLSRDEFEKDYALLGLQRNLRILGVFTRLALAFGKPHYTDFVPRVWGHIMTNLEHPALQELSSMIRSSLPEPTPEIIQGLKAQCPTTPKL